MDPQGPAPAPAEFDPDYLKHALKAFKKRLKLTRLNQESGLGGHGPMTGGKKATADAIVAPREFPRAVWDELVRQGKLRDTGGGFFQLKEP